MLHEAPNDPLQRIVNLQNKYTSSDRFKKRHTSEHILDDHLKKRLKQELNAAVDYDNEVTCQYIDNRHPSTKLLRKSSQFSNQGGALQTIRPTRSLPQNIINDDSSRASEKRVRQNSSNLPAIYNTPKSNHNYSKPFNRIAPSQKAFQIIGVDQDSEPTYLTRASKLTLNTGMFLQADQSSRQSQLGAGPDLHNNSLYQVDLIKERRDEIQRLIQKRQRKAAMEDCKTITVGRLTSDTMKVNFPTIPPNTTRNLQDNNNNETEEEEESEKEESAKEESVKEESVKEVIRQGRVTFSKKSRSPKTNRKTPGLQEETDQKQDDDKMPNNQIHGRDQPELETMKRAQKRAFKGLVSDSEDKHEQRVAKIQQQLLSRNQKKTKSKDKKILQSPKKSPKDPSETSVKKQAITNNGQKNEQNNSEKQKLDQDSVHIVEPVTEHREIKTINDQPPEIKFATADNKFQSLSPSQPVFPRGKSTRDLALTKSPSHDALSVGRQSKVKFDIDVDQAAATMKFGGNDSISQAFSSIKMTKSFRRRSSHRSMGRSEMISTPDTHLDSKFKKVEEIVDKKTALRIQKMSRSQSKAVIPEEVDFIQKVLEEKYDQPEDEDEDEEDLNRAEGSDVQVEVREEVDSAEVQEQQKREQFNSQLDMYSDIPSTHRQTFGRRRGTMLRGQSVSMKPIEAAESEEESASQMKSGSAKESEQEADNEDEEQKTEPDNVDLGGERDAYKKKLQEKEIEKKEDEGLCGSRMVKKMEDFTFQISVEAGLAMPDQFTTEKVSSPISATEKYIQKQMLETGNTSLFRLEKTKNDDKGQIQKVMDRYIEDFRGKQAFFSLCKQATESKWADPSVKNLRIQYYSACTKANSVAKPIMSKIKDKQLVIRDIKLNDGDSMGLHDNMMLNPDLVSKLFLDHNGLDPSQLAQILEGFGSQRQLVNLTIQGSAINEKTVEQISNMLKRKVPDHLQELHFLHAKAVWRATDELLRNMRVRNYLRKLSLVEAGLNDFSMVHLCEVIKTSKTLQTLDISWNKLIPVQMRPLLEILSKNRRLTNLNLAWNNIMDIYAEYEDDIIRMLGKIIKHSRTMQHMNLSGTGLSEQVIYEMGTFMRRSRSVQVIHLSGNPGITSENFVYLQERIKARPIEQMERFIRIQALVKNALSSTGIANNIINGIKMKIERENDFNQLYRKDPIELSINDQLIYQRMLGHKMDLPGSGQWYESSKNSVECKTHYKHECWICDGHTYSIIFWSRGMCYKINPILPKDKAEKIRFEIDSDFGAGEEGDKMFENTNVDYNELPDKTPYLCGSFTGWRYFRMQSLEDFCAQFDERREPFKIACELSQIRTRILHPEHCNEHEMLYMKIAEINEGLRLTYEWRQLFAKNLKYKRPFLMNSYFYYDQPSGDGTLHDLYNTDFEGDAWSDSSSEEEEEEEEKVAVQEPVKQKVMMSQLTPQEREELKKKEKKKKNKPLPIVPDVNKIDKVFILKVLCKPGKHQYMIKYKDTKEPRQAHYLKKVRKMDRAQSRASSAQVFDQMKYEAAKSALAPECFFYQCEIPRRTEELLPFAKPIQTTVVERKFDRDISIWKPWRIDTAATLAQAYNEDIKVWKGYRFIKIEDDRWEVEAVIKKYYQRLKDVFLYVASNSVWPNISQLDFCAFAEKAKIMDNVVNIATVDRAFIGATRKDVETAAPCNGLRRFEFIEILVRLANMKYYETKVVKTYAEASEKLFQDCIVGNYSHDPWQEFRTKDLWTMDVNDLYDANMENLKKIYNGYKTTSKPNMELQDCIALCTQDAKLEMSEKDISYCYGYSHMSVVNEERHWKRYFNLEFVEFLEFIGRLALQRFKNSSAEMAAQPLVNKIEFILDDIMAGFGMTRHEINVEAIEFSESDDDY